MRGILSPHSVNLLNHLRPDFSAVGTFDQGPQWNIPVAPSPHNRLYLVERGRAEVLRQGRRTVLSGGRLYLLPLGPDYGFACRGELHKIYFHFRLDAAPGFDVFQNLDRILAAPIPGSVSTAHLRALLARGTLESHLEVATVFHTCLGALPLDRIRIGLPPKSVLSFYEPLFLALRGWHIRDMRLGAMAKAASMSPGAWSIRFKRDMGVPYKIWLDRVFLEKVLPSLMEKEASVRRIAHQYGFTDEFQFSRWFKNRLGFAPLHYRRRFGEGAG